MEPVRSDMTTDRRTAVDLAKRLLVDSIWRTAKIEVDGVTFPDTQEIFDGRAPEGMSVDDIVTEIPAREHRLSSRLAVHPRIQPHHRRRPRARRRPLA